MPASPRKAPAPATVVLSREHEPGMTKPKQKTAPTRRLSVPPPPGRPTARSVLRAVPPEDDPFLAAYLACTKSTGGGRGGEGGKKRTGVREPKKGQRWFAWARFGLGGLSCKRDNSAVEQSMVRLAKLPEVDPMDS